jgi:hypothetical protein
VAQENRRREEGRLERAKAAKEKAKQKEQEEAEQAERVANAAAYVQSAQLQDYPTWTQSTLKVGRFTRSDTQWKKIMPPGNPKYGLTWWPVTLSCKGASIPGAWWLRMKQYMMNWCESSITNLEPGKEEKHIHVQAVWCMMFDPSLKTKLNAHIKQECDIMPGSNSHLVVKIMEGNHSPSG